VVLGIHDRGPRMGPLRRRQAARRARGVFSVGFGPRLLAFGADTDYRIQRHPSRRLRQMSGENPMEAGTANPGEFMSHRGGMAPDRIRGPLA